MSDTTPGYDPPLAGVHVLDLSGGRMLGVGRLLIDLGADVTRVELADVTDDAPVGPVADGIDIGTAILARGSRRTRLSLATATGRREWANLLASAQILIESTRPGSAAESLLDVPGLHAAHPELVILSISDFGRGNDFSRWQATTPVLHALSSELSRSGIPGRDPLVPPGELPYDVAAAQAAFMTLSVYVDRLRTGEGKLIDFSILDGTMQTLDPAYGMVGSASAGVPLSALPRGRAEERHKYPIIRCRDGYARICVLAQRQWRGMFAWLGEPAEFAGAEYDQIGVRFSSQTLLPAIAKFFAGKTRAELEREGQEHGVPTAAVLTLDEALATEQIVARRFFRETRLAPGLTAPTPAGVTEVDGARAFVDEPCDEDVAPPTDAPVLAARARAGRGRPLEGIRVLDLGVIVVGGDTGRLFGDLGADVIKIENSAFLDGSRASLPATNMSPGFAAGHRNKRAIGVNLRDPDGKRIVRELVKLSDIVLTNFKPGVIESLGLDYDSLKDANPGIVVVDSSAFGSTGPWAKRLGYGPLVRAAAGFTDQWVYPGEPGTFSDAITVYPDHVCARVGALTALALLVRRERRHVGGSVSVAQSEVMLSHMAEQVAARHLEREGHTITELPARGVPWGLFPAAGDDDWVAITVRDDAEWSSLCTVIDRPDLASDPALQRLEGRRAQRERIETAVAEWAALLTPYQAMERLQAAGVPAGAMLRAIDLPEWPYYQQRRDFRQESHPSAAEPYTMENVQIHAEGIPDPPLGNAPLLGEQTVEIVVELLGLSEADAEDLIARGVLEAAPDASRASSAGVAAGR